MVTKLLGYSGAAAAAAPSNELKDALAPFRQAFIGLFVVSCLINILYLTGSFFMLQVYDRVLPSRSVSTLVGLGLLAAMLYGFQGVLDFVRGRILVLIGTGLDMTLSSRIFDIMVRMALVPRKGNAAQPTMDIDRIRGFLSNGGPTAFFDLPWMPLYLIICFAFHFWIGFAALVGAVILVIFTFLTEHGTKQPTANSMQHMVSRNALGEASRRNTEVLHAMGMIPQIGGLWREANNSFLNEQLRTSNVVLGLGSISRVLRFALQSFILGLAAYLVINQEASAGVMIASSILVSRALAPVELAIGQWKHFVGARQSWQRLTELLAQSAPQRRMALPAPREALTVENVTLVAPGEGRVLVADVCFTLKAGAALGIIGRNGSGKSSLARGLVGVWPPVRGSIRIDGATLEQWGSERLGRHIGYLPQNVELFAGTVAQNISRFAENPDAKDVIDAATAAGVHELILRLPNGYETQIGDNGGSLSAGQRQRIALARALYGDPFLVILDEPNSNIDADGDTALTRAILSVRARGGVVVVIAHRPSTLAGVDQVLVMNNGHAQIIGEKEEVLRKVSKPDAQPTPQALNGTTGRSA